MAWTTPKTWSSEPLTSTDMNTYIRDNQNHLYNRLEAYASANVDEVSDYTTTSTTFEDVDATEGKFQHTITTNGGPVKVGFSGVTLNPGTNGRYAFFDIDVDGSRWAGDDGITRGDKDQDERQIVSFTALITGLSAGSHVFKLQWKVNAGTLTLYAGAGSSDGDLKPQFWVAEA
jgi:hypothetical protein